MSSSRAADVPRPKDDSRACLRRLRDGHNHALVDLAAALEREGDPRARPVNAMLGAAMAKVEAFLGRPGAGALVVAEWQGLARKVLAAMEDPRYESVAGHAASGGLL